MREIIDREIMGYKFRMQQYPARYGGKIYAKLLKQIGPVMEAASGFGAAGLVQGLKEVDPDAVVDIIYEMFRGLFCNGEEVCNTKVSSEHHFDNLFAGPEGYQLLFKVFEFIIEINYGDFLKGMGGGTENEEILPPKINGTPNE